MNRLTRKSKVGEYLPVKHLNIRHEDTTSEDTLTEMLDRLGGYEDLEVAPEQIREVDSKCVDLLGVGLMASVEKFGEFFEEITEYIEYQRAEENGLLLRLPCKVGDTVYRIDIDPNMTSEIEPYYIDNITICNDGEVLLKYDSYDGVICSMDSLVNGTPYLDYYMTYLSLEEAEAKLAEMEGGHE